MNFSLLLPKETVFERGGLKKLCEYVKKFGTKTLIVTTDFLVKNLFLSEIIADFHLCGISAVVYKGVLSEPTPQIIREAVKVAKTHKIDFVIGIGGGSCIDVAKAVSGLVNNEHDIEEYLEGIGTKTIENAPIPFVAIPTTAGTGAEATKNAVISSREKNYKKSFRDNRLMASLVIIDPTLTLKVPKQVTASTGMDAITQIIESYTTVKASPFTDSLCLSCAKYFNSLEKIYENGEDLEHRENMCIVSYFSGITLANSGLGAVHGIGASLGVNLNIAHGEACAIMLESVMRKNMEVCEKKYSLLAEEVLGKRFDNTKDGANALINFIACLVKKLNIKTLKEYSLTAQQIETIAKGSEGNSMNGNPKKLSQDEIKELILTVC